MNTSEIASTIEQLASEDGMAREKARQALVATSGKEVLTTLVGRLDDRRHQVRWEATKALSEIGDVATANALVHAMHDSNSDVAWVAAEGIARMGEPGLLAVLSGLIRSSRSGEFHRVAHHALKEFRRMGAYREVVDLVMKALDGVEPQLSAPVATYQALQQMQVGAAAK